MNEKEMNEALEEESQLEFNRFDAGAAYQIGQYISGLAISRNLKLVVDISAFGKTLYHFSSDLAIPDNEHWAQRKKNTVMMFSHSTRYMALKLDDNQSLLADKYGLDPAEYAAVPGAVPIRLKNQGVIGAVAVSGMKPMEDHQMAVSGIRRFLYPDEQNLNSAA